MRDPFAWSFSVGALFGINIRIHVVMPIVLIALPLRPLFATNLYYPGTWLDVLQILIILFISVFLHEMGHCFAARSVDGDPREILIWPLGGLASLRVPNTAHAHLISTLGGPMVNVALCLAAVIALAFAVDPSYQPPWNPFVVPQRVNADGAVEIYRWFGTLNADNKIVPDQVTAFAPILLARIFYVNWTLALLNLLVLAFPLDGGKILQAVLWRYIGFRRATQNTIYSSVTVLFILAIVAIVTAEPLVLFLAGMVFAGVYNEWRALEGDADDNPFGYDFSQGYTSLEREEAPPPPPRKKKLNFFQRWLQRRAQLKLQREQEQQEADERRMDELLDKLHQSGKDALTDEEHRFMKRFSERYRKS